MKIKWLYFLAGVVIMATFLLPSAWSGQVVSKKEREWAKKALTGEAALAPVTGKNTVAVLTFNNETPNRDLDPFQKGIAIMLITDLSKVEKLTIVERTKIQALLDEMSLSRSGIMDPASAPKTGRLLGARFIIGGDFLQGEKTPLKISSDILNVNTPKKIETLFSQGQYTELIALEKKLAFKIIKQLDIKLSQKEQEELKKPMSRNMRALGYLFYGIDLSDQGKYQTAKRYYEKAVDLDPGLTVARQAIIELIHLKLTPQPSKSEVILKTTRDRTSTVREQGFDQRLSRSAPESAQISDTTAIRVKW